MLRSRSISEPQGGIDPQLTGIGVSPQLGIMVQSNMLSSILISGAGGFADFQTIPQFALLHTHTRKNLTLRSGFDIRRLNVTLIQENSATPAYTFVGFLGANGLLGSNASQPQAVASSVSASLFGPNGPFTTNRGWRSTQQEYFTQADYRLRRDLNLNLGVRYSYFGVYTEANNAISNLYAVDTSGAIVPNVSPFKFGRTANVVAPVTDDRPFYQPDRNNFQPRIGLAWDIGGHGRTVVRAGYSIYADRIYQLQFTPVAFNTPFAVSSSVANLPFQLGGGIPVNPQTPSVAAVDPAIRNPYTQRFNVAVERRLGADTSVTAAYVGARGRKLTRWSEPNAYGSVPLSARPDPRFTDERIITNDSSSQYDSLQIFAKRRLARGLDFTVSYTLAHAQDDFSADVGFPRAPTLLNRGGASATGFQGGGAQFEPRPLRADFGDSDFDMRHNLTLSHIWELPFGRGRRLLGNAGNLVNTLVGGWALSGIAILRSGEALYLRRGVDYNDDGDASTDRPALISGSLDDLYADGGAGRTQYLIRQQDALTRLATPADVTDPFAVVKRNALHSPSVRVYDLSAIKRFQLREDVSLSFTANAFNVFNRAQFASPSATLSSSLFGVVTRTRAGATPRQLQFGLKVTF